MRLSSSAFASGCASRFTVRPKPASPASAACQQPKWLVTITNPRLRSASSAAMPSRFSARCGNFQPCAPIQPAISKASPCEAISR